MPEKMGILVGDPQAQMSLENLNLENEFTLIFCEKERNSLTMPSVTGVLQE